MMNDLIGLDWSNQSSNVKKPPNYNAAFSTLKPAPAPSSGRASPLASSAPLKPPSKPATPANDSFSNLVSFSSSSTGKNLTLQEQQAHLAQSKAQNILHGTSNGQGYLVAGDDSFWNSLGSGRSTPGLRDEQAKTEVVEEDDFLAAFSAPPPNLSKTKVISPTASSLPKASELMIEDDEDDDPFGLSQFQAKQNTSSKQETVFDDEDVLGLLGRPAAVRAVPEVQKRSTQPSMNAHPQDKAVAELVDMGFPTEKARQALETTDSGTDVQAAVGWLLNQAHSEARERNQRQKGSSETEGATSSVPVRSERDASQRISRNGTPVNDASKVATEIGTTFLKTAGSLWKQGQKKVQQAVQDFNSDSDSSQPKWMRETRTEPKSGRKPDVVEDDGRQMRVSAAKQQPSATDEAMMLETSRPERPQRVTQRSRPDNVFDSDTSRDHSPAMPSRLRESQAPQSLASRSKPQPFAPSKAVLNRQTAEEQAATAYVSSARRRKPAAVASVSTIPPATEPQLLEEVSKPPFKQLQSDARAVRNSTKPNSIPSKSTPIAVRPPAPARNIPPLSAISLKASHADRIAGNEHFKRGDYSSAHTSYTKSLSYLPKSHPITVVLLTNRALTALKIGEPKTAVSDADTTIALVGPSEGESETVDLANGDPAKPMREYYGKALMRKAEALEQMEKWAEAAVVWRKAVEGGHGGATSIQGRSRAEKAANPSMAKPKPAIPRKPAARQGARLNTSTMAKPTEAAAVSRLRAQNAAAEKADDEKFALTDSVDSRITAWKGGKQDNLRALLGSLETVLWPEAGWKKISMADLVLPNKVKIQYMKGIAKVHPDKIPTNASTEQRMIAGAVFSTLNEAWDKFKKENNL